jgi:hypothetical protein
VTVAFTNLVPFKGDFSFGKTKSRREPNPGCRGLTDLGDVMLCQKNPSVELYNGQAHCHDEVDLLTQSL